VSDEPSNIGMAPPHPGEFIRDEILDELDLSISAAAEVLGVRRATLSDLVNNHTTLSPEMALRVEMASCAARSYSQSSIRSPGTL
jgi:addiction module HigA family antidote